MSNTDLHSAVKSAGISLTSDVNAGTNEGCVACDTCLGCVSNCTLCVGCVSWS